MQLHPRCASRVVAVPPQSLLQCACGRPAALPRCASVPSVHAWAQGQPSCSQASACLAYARAGGGGPCPSRPSACPRQSVPRCRRFHVCLQQSLAERNGSSGAPEGDHDDSEEEAKGMARLFAEVGEAYTGLIAEGGPQVRGRDARD